METYYHGMTPHCTMEQSPAGNDAVNIGNVERLISIVAGGSLALGGLRRLDSLAGLAATLIGGGLIYRGVSGNCMTYRALGVSTAQRNPATGVPAQYGTKVEKSIFINRDPEEVYHFWRDLENLPRFMSHLVAVQLLDASRSHWAARGPLGRLVEWDAEIINEKEDEVIAWRSLDGSSVDTAGSVHFHPGPAGVGTDLRVSLKYNPPGGKLGIGLAKLFGEEPERQIEDDLRSLKRCLESGEFSTAYGQTMARAESFEAAAAACPVEDLVEEASLESFPASDPPGWIKTSATRSIPRT